MTSKPENQWCNSIAHHSTSRNERNFKKRQPIRDGDGKQNNDVSGGLALEEKVAD